jgi:hypothetical protein
LRKYTPSAAAVLERPGVAAKFVTIGWQVSRVYILIVRPEETMRNADAGRVWQRSGPHCICVDGGSPAATTAGVWLKADPVIVVSRRPRPVCAKQREYTFRFRELLAVAAN